MHFSGVVTDALVYAPPPHQRVEVVVDCELDVEVVMVWNLLNVLILGAV